MFVICAYKESPYLHLCIESLKKQSMKSTIVCATSTPNSHIENICQEYGVQVYVNQESRGIASDWNFALLAGRDADYITLVHQDDIYEPKFLEETIKYMNKAKKPLIAFTDYYEIRNDKKIEYNRLLRIKRIMMILWRVPALWKIPIIYKMVFLFGCPICCPSVTFARKHLPNEALFNEDYKNSCDFLAWVELRDLAGDFVYCPKRLMGHRIHAESETSLRISDNTRSDEDLKILTKLAPQKLAKIIHYFYIKAMNSNKT